jgi:hypothetical protein
MPPASTPVSLLAPQHFGELSFPRRGEWQPLYERYVDTFIGPSLLSKDEHVLQLVVQVLTKIGLRGGKVSEQVSKFITKAFNDFIAEDASQILIGFQFKFCCVEPHQVYDAMINGFISVFGKLRASLDTVILAQLKPMWTNDAAFNLSVFDPLRRVFTIFTECLDDVVLKKKGEDIGVINALSKRILPALDGDRPPTIQFWPFTTLRARVHLLTNDSLALALAADPGEEAMSHIVDFLLSVSPVVFQSGATPPYLGPLFRKNDKNLSPALIRRLADLPESLASLSQIHTFLRTPIQNALDAHRDQLEQLLPLLWKFGSVDEFFRPPPIGVPPEVPAPFPGPPRIMRKSLMLAATSGPTGPLPRPAMGVLRSGAPPPFDAFACAETIAPAAMFGEVHRDSRMQESMVESELAFCMDEAAEAEEGSDASDSGSESEEDAADRDAIDTEGSDNED